MSAHNQKYLDTSGETVIGIGICDRCHFKFMLTELYSDPNYPGLKVCKDDLDVYDPWRLPPPPPDKFNLPFTRPEVSLALPASSASTPPSFTADSDVTADSDITADTP